MELTEWNVETTNKDFRHKSNNSLLEKGKRKVRFLFRINFYMICLNSRHWMEPILVKDKLSFNEVLEILHNQAIKRDCQPCVRPKGHQVFFFSAEDEPVEKNDWRYDQYRWFNGGVTKLPRHQPVLKKHYFYADSKEGHTKEF